MIRTLPSTLSMSLPVTVELVIADGADSACWQATFGTASANSSPRFRAKGP